MVILVRRTEDGWSWDATGTPVEQEVLKALGTTWIPLPFTSDSDPEKVRLKVIEQTGVEAIIL